MARKPQENKNVDYSNWTKKPSKEEPWQKDNPDTRNTMADLKPEKAKEILKDKTVHGKALTPKQKRFMGWVAGGRKQAEERRPRTAEDKKKTRTLIKKAQFKGKMGTR